MYRTLSLMLGLAVCAGTAQAGGFEAKTMRAPFSSREVERGLVLGKGWVELELGTDVKNATGYWDSQGQKVDFNDANWLYTTQSLNARYGITQRGELYWKFKTHYVQLTNDTLGTNIQQFGLGDPEFGYTFEFFRTLAPITSVIGYARYKAPLGNESPGNYIGGPNTFSAVVLTTGTPDVTLGAAIKRQFGPGAFILDANYVRRVSGTPLYTLETTNNQFQVRLKPGDLLHVKADAQLQISVLALQGGVAIEHRNATMVGNSSGGLLPSRYLEPIADSDGWSVDANLGAVANVTQNIDLEFRTRLPLAGEDFLFFPIEDINPSRGITYTGAFAFRY